MGKKQTKSILNYRLLINLADNIFIENHHHRALVSMLSFIVHTRVGVSVWAHNVYVYVCVVCLCLRMYETFCNLQQQKTIETKPIKNRRNSIKFNLIDTYRKKSTAQLEHPNERAATTTTTIFSALLFDLLCVTYKAKSDSKHDHEHRFNLKLFSTQIENKTNSKLSKCFMQLQLRKTNKNHHFMIETKPIKK